MKRKTVKWIDSANWGGWQDKETKFSPAVCKSIGYVWDETDEHIVLAQSIDGEGNPGNLVAIPKISVVT